MTNAARIMPRFALAFALLAGALTLPASAADVPIKVRLTGGETLIPQLAAGLGYFRQEGLEVTPVKVEDLAPNDYEMQKLLNDGRVDASLNWFQHVLFGAGNGAPVKAVMVLNDAPGVTVMVANRIKGEIRSASDFKGRRIAEGAALSTKSYLTHFMTLKAGLPAHSYTPVMVESDGRREAVIQALKEGQVDVMTFLEPMTSSILETGMVTTLYDFTNSEGMRKALGAPWLAQCVFMAPAFIEAHPETAQRLVNALVRTMRFVNSHTAEEIAQKLPAAYFAKKDREAEIRRIRKALPTFAKDDYSFAPSTVKLVAEAVLSADFDASEEGRFRAKAKNATIRLEDLYTNRFVDRAMGAIR